VAFHCNAAQPLFYALTTAVLALPVDVLVVLFLRDNVTDVFCAWRAFWRGGDDISVGCRGAAARVAWVADACGAETRGGTCWCCLAHAWRINGVCCAWWRIFALRRMLAHYASDIDVNCVLCSVRADAEHCCIKMPRCVWRGDGSRLAADIGDDVRVSLYGALPARERRAFDAHWQAHC